MATSNPNAIDLKFVVVGDGAVGKTCLLQAFSSDEEINMEHVPTIFENSQKEYKVGSQKYNLDLWDTAGQENFDRLRPLSYKGVDCFLLCFDVSNATSLDNIKFKWIKEVNKAIEEGEGHAKGQVMLVGTKSDKRGQKSDLYTECTKENIRDHRQTVGESRGYKDNWESKIMYVETSAIKRTGVTEVFETAIKMCMAEKDTKAAGNCCTIM